MDKQFNLDDVSVTLIIDGAPIDISSGLIIDGDFFQMEKENKEENNTRRGTKNTSYTTNSQEDKSRIITLTYLPVADAVREFDLILKNKSKFGLVVNCNSEPRFKFLASECVIMEEPSIKISGKDGFDNREFKIRATDGEYVYL